MKTIIMQQDERGVYVDSGVEETQTGTTFRFGSLAHEIARMYKIPKRAPMSDPCRDAPVRPIEDHIHDCGYDAEWIPKSRWPWKDQPKTIGALP
jgi:hypothetical protein